MPLTAPSRPSDPARPVALVTGASGSIGRAVARRLAADGFRLALTGRRTEALDALAQELAGERPGTETVTLAVELTDAEAVSRAADAVLEAFGAIDVLVNNAGGWSGSRFGGFIDKPAADLAAEVADNLLTAVFACRAALPAMVAQGYGRIVNVSSIAGIVALDGHSAYSAAKAGHSGLTRQLAVEFGPAGVTTNCVAPGAVLTERAAPLVEDKDPAIMTMLNMTPTGRLATPDEVAGLVAFFASEDARSVNGQTVAIDGGMTSV